MKKPVVCATYYYFNDTKDRETLLWCATCSYSNDIFLYCETSYVACSDWRQNQSFYISFLSHKSKSSVYDDKCL
jgi:hypothetical protein